MELWQTAYSQWLHDNLPLSKRSVSHYLSAIRNIRKWVNIDLSEINTIQDFEVFERAALHNERFIARDKVGNRMYSIALRHFEDFVIANVTKELTVFPEVISDSMLVEGGRLHIIVNAYERNQRARYECIKHYGATCMVCGFDFSREFGSMLQNIIHVHHIKPMSEIKEMYVVDPVKDLVPVCPNCHLVIHSKPEGIYSIDEVKAMRNQMMIKNIK